MPPSEHVVRLADGRSVGYRLSGATEGPAILALHGTPGSRYKFSAADAIAEAIGVRIVSVDRWGYGLTDRHPRPALLAFADDMAAVLDLLGIDRVNVIGISGGGPFAVAVAAGRPDRVGRLAVVSPVGLITQTAPGPGYRPFHRFCFEVLPRIPGATRCVFAAYRAFLRAAPALAVRVVTARAGAVDRAVVMRPDMRVALAATFGAGLEPGVDGPVIDLELFSRPWDISLDSITAPTQIWLGRHDTNVPIAAVEALAAAIPGACLTRVSDAGHFWIATRFADVLHWLVDAPRPLARVNDERDLELFASAAAPGERRSATTHGGVSPGCIAPRHHVD
jgi:pimeloyl-ACP methyl ester carboxylesterase